VRIVSFDNVVFGRQDEQDSIPLEMKSALQQIAMTAGAFDFYGDNQYRQPLTLTRKFLLTGTTIAVDLDELRGKTNTRGRLLVETRSGESRGTWAKLTSVNYTNSPEQTTYLPVNLTFVLSWPWFEPTDDRWFLDSGLYLDDGLDFDGNYTTQAGAGTFSIDNDGGGAITRGYITITGGTLPTLTNNTNGWSVAYGGTIAAGSSLVYDIGAQSAEVGGSNVWADITLGSNQTGIMRLDTGVNSITYTGGGTVIWNWEIGRAHV